MIYAARGLFVPSLDLWKVNFFALLVDVVIAYCLLMTSIQIEIFGLLCYFINFGRTWWIDSKDSKQEKDFYVTQHNTVLIPTT